MAGLSMLTKCFEYNSKIAEFAGGSGKLRPIILALNPDTRVTSRRLDMDAREPDRRLKFVQREGPARIVPAGVGGEWALGSHVGGSSVTRAPSGLRKTPIRGGKR
jgi:hypothetical protein